MHITDKEFEENLMVKIAWYYYIENMTQQNISDLLGLSRMKVVKLLEKARQAGIVQFQIRSNLSKRMELEQELINRYSLKMHLCSTNPNRNEVNETVLKLLLSDVFR